jgi:hypothetical protein
MSLDDFEEAVTEIADDDRAWWPFLWLRPDKHSRLSLRRLIALSILYGAPLSLFAGVLSRFSQPAGRAQAPLVMVSLPLVLLFVGSVVIAPMWNRRAARLRAQSPRRQRFS